MHAAPTGAACFVRMAFSLGPDGREGDPVQMGVKVTQSSYSGRSQSNKSVCGRPVLSARLAGGGNNEARRLGAERFCPHWAATVHHEHGGEPVQMVRLRTGVVPALCKRRSPHQSSRRQRRRRQALTAQAGSDPTQGTASQASLGVSKRTCCGMGCMQQPGEWRACWEACRPCASPWAGRRRCGHCSPGGPAWAITCPPAWPPGRPGAVQRSVRRRTDGGVLVVGIAVVRHVGG